MFVGKLGTPSFVINSIPVCGLLELFPPSASIFIIQSLDPLVCFICKLLVGIPVPSPTLLEVLSIARTISPELVPSCLLIQNVLEGHVKFDGFKPSPPLKPSEKP